ncbi:helix-turn-helix domain-containing protein [Providencia rettgeri]|uniref:helix-turn-helix domain-containing protein n=1 Tax=Providencia rettgeri TaxID=587 RepID=UPI0035254263
MDLSKKIITHCEIQNNFLSLCCGKIIKKIRKENGMTGAELAKKMNVSQQQMSRYERGINKLSIDMLFNIAMVLDVSFENIIKSVISEAKKSCPHDALSFKNKISNSDISCVY